MFITLPTIRLLWDTVRVVTRLVGQLGQTMGQALKRFRNHTRAARRRMQQIQRMTPKQRKQQQIGMSVTYHASTLGKKVAFSEWDISSIVDIGAFPYREAVYL
jgi:hypothetical protein